MSVPQVIFLNVPAEHRRALNEILKATGRRGLNNPTAYGAEAFFVRESSVKWGSSSYARSQIAGDYKDVLVIECGQVKDIELPGTTWGRATVSPAGVRVGCQLFKKEKVKELAKIL